MCFRRFFYQSILHISFVFRLTDLITDLIIKHFNIQLTLYLPRKSDKAFKAQVNSKRSWPGHKVKGTCQRSQTWRFLRSLNTSCCLYFAVPVTVVGKAFSINVFDSAGQVSIALFYTSTKQFSSLGYLHLHEIVEGLYFYFSLSLCVCVCVCVWVCSRCNKLCIPYEVVSAKL